MASSVRIRHNVNGYAAIRRSPGVRAQLEHLGRRIMEAGNRRTGGADYRMSSVQGGGRAPRWRVTVITATGRAMRDNAINNTLVRNLRGGNG